MKCLKLFIILSICVICIYSYNINSEFHKNSALIQRTLQDIESPRKKTGHYFLYPYYGWYALSWIYWIKVKLIVIAFFVGTAFIWAIQYVGKFHQQCPSVDHVHYGHYRSMDDPSVVRLLQKLRTQVSFE